MNKPKIFASAITYTVGISIGWVMKPSQNSDNSEDESYRSSSRSLTLGERTSKTSAQKIRQKRHDLIERLVNEAANPESLALLIADINEHEISGLLGQFQDRASLQGLSDSDKKIFQQLLKRWYSLSKTNALSWLSELPIENERIRLMSDLVSSTVGEDFDGALELAKQFLRKENGALNLPFTFYMAATEKSPDQFVDLYKLSKYNGNSSYGYGLNYPEGFDFKKTLNLLHDLSGSLQEGERLSSFPTNLLKTWASRNPQEAYDWLMSDKKVTGNDRITQFIAGYAERATPAEIGSFLGDVWDAEKPNYSAISTMLTNTNSSEVYETFLKNADPSISREEHHVGLLKNLANSGSYRATARYNVLKSIPADQRLEVLKNPKLERYVRSPRLQRELRKSLLQLGHTAEQLDSEL